MNLTDGANFLVALIKREKPRFNQKIKFPCDTKRRTRKITINNGWLKQVIQILREERDGEFIFKGNM